MPGHGLTQDALDRARTANPGHRVVALAGDFSGRILRQYRQWGYADIRPVHGALLRNLELEAVVRGRNLGDKGYREWGIDFGALGFAVDSFIPPRMYGVDLIYQF